jgi:hypothetical protein
MRLKSLGFTFVFLLAVGTSRSLVAQSNYYCYPHATAVQSQQRCSCLATSVVGWTPQSGGGLTLVLYDTLCGTDPIGSCYIPGSPVEKTSCPTMAKLNHPEGNLLNPAILPNNVIQVAFKDDPSNSCADSREVFDLWLKRELQLQREAVSRSLHESAKLQPTHGLNLQRATVSE